MVNNTAFQLGGVAYSFESGTTFSACDFKKNSAPFGSVLYSTVTDDEVIGVEIDQSSFSENEAPAIVCAAPVVIRNPHGIVRSDVASVPVMRCSETAEYCDSQYCSDVTSEDDNSTLMGIDCYCEPDGVVTDPLVGSCANSASLSDPIAGVAITSEDVWVFVNKPEQGAVVVQFSNQGDVRMQWDVSVSSNPSQLVWVLPIHSGSLAAGEPWSVPLQVSSEGLQARKAAYITRFTLNASSPEPTPIPESRSIDFNVHTVISASPNATLSYANITNVPQLTAAGTVGFDVTSIDISGMVIQDAESVAYSASLVHSTSGTSVACSVSYDTVSKRHKGHCALQGLEAGGFELNLLLGSEVVGGGAYHITVKSCPDLFQLSDDGLSCTCPAGRYELGNTCVECADGTHKPAPGIERADCVACVSPETSNEARTACDMCVTGYYRKGDSCALCPNGDVCTVTDADGRSVPAPGFWRAGDESTEILQCRYGDLACPGDSTANPATGPDPYCAAEYEGPLCSQCTEEYFASWEGGGACQKCAAGKSHTPTIGLGAGVFGFVGLLLACASKFCQKRDTGEAPPNAFLVEAEKLYLLADVKLFTLFLSAQADTPSSRLLFVRFRWP